MGSQSEKDLIENMDWPSLGRAFCPSITRKKPLWGLMVVSGRTPRPHNTVGKRVGFEVRSAWKQAARQDPSPPLPCYG